eukprot:4645622-Alexandrium_andersonii.AAC.1
MSASSSFAAKSFLRTSVVVLLSSLVAASSRSISIALIGGAVSMPMALARFPSLAGTGTRSVGLPGLA